MAKKNNSKLSRLMNSVSTTIPKKEKETAVVDFSEKEGPSLKETNKVVSEPAKAIKEETQPQTKEKPQKAVSPPIEPPKQELPQTEPKIVEQAKEVVAKPTQAAKKGRKKKGGLTDSNRTSLNISKGMLKKITFIRLMKDISVESLIEEVIDDYCDKYNIQIPKKLK